MTKINCTVLILMFTFVIISSSELHCRSSHKECKQPNTTRLGKLSWGNCSESGVLVRYNKINLVECAKECLLTAKCTSINFRTRWKTCDLISAVLSESNTRRDPDCASSEISTWDIKIVGKCAGHICQIGKKCRFNQSTGTSHCEDVYCAKSPPNIPFSKPVEKFGISRSYNVGHRHDCTNGYIIYGTSYVTCRKENTWEVSFSCIKDDVTIERFKNNCYMFSETRLTWPNARSDCEKGGMSMAAIQSATENQWIFEKVHSKYGSGQVWLGGKKRSHGFIWVGISGAETKFSYTNFKQGEPNNFLGQSEECLSLYCNTGEWNDNICNVKDYFICKATC